MGTLLGHDAEGDAISVMFMSDGVTGRDFNYDPQSRREIQERKDMALAAGRFTVRRHHVPRPAKSSDG